MLTTHFWWLESHPFIMVINGDGANGIAIATSDDFPWFSHWSFQLIGHYRCWHVGWHRRQVDHSVVPDGEGGGLAAWQPCWWSWRGRELANVEWPLKMAGWWFGTFFIYPYIGDNHPNWLIFFRRVQTTNNQQAMETRWVFPWKWRWIFPVRYVAVYQRVKPTVI